MISPPRRGNSAGKDSTFTIDGTGVAEFSTTIDSIASRIKINDVLHTPQLRSNLISVSKLVGKGMTVAFEGETARVKRSDGVTILVVVKEVDYTLWQLTTSLMGPAKLILFRQRERP